MKSLKIIQTLAKIGRVVSKVVFICCIVGFCGCAFGIISLALGAAAFQFGGVAVRGLIEKNAEMSMAALYASMAVGAVVCAAEAVLSKFAEVYFVHELADGTPFTLRGSKELLRLGIINVAVSLGMGTVCGAGLALASLLYPELKEVEAGFSSFGFGIAMIVLSLFCRYGAELNESKTDGAENAPENKPIEQEKK